LTGPDYVIEAGPEMEAAAGALPDRPGVFVVWPREGAPLVAKTALLRRRLGRLLGKREQPSRLLTLRDTAGRIECWRTGSALESSLVQYRLTRRHFPDTYRRVLRLKMPPYVKIVLTNRFPRSRVTAHLSREEGLWYGPFRSRASAESFESGVLDLFQMRRCQEELAVSPAHPGCIYGEMGMCLRPCQAVVGEDEYRHEAARVVEFLQTDGKSLRSAAEAARDRLSEEMQFEEAARQHKRVEKLDELLKQRDELARDLDRQCGVAVTGSAEEGAVDLWFVYRGTWQGRRTFRVAAGWAESQAGESRSMDARLRELAAEVKWKEAPPRRRQDHLALLARWYYSSWREGEWLRFDGPDQVPYRRLVRAISRVASAGRA
jgi:excinuclease UvrABC nuclease subunit